jgi:hypothetical protein
LRRRDNSRPTNAASVIHGSTDFDVTPPLGRLGHAIAFPVAKGVGSAGTGRPRMRVLPGMFAAAAGVLLMPTLWAHPAHRPRPANASQPLPRCEPVNPHGVVPAAAAVDTGEFTLTLVATSGPSAGASVTGRLWLVSTTTARDSEILSGTRAPLGDTARVPLYGASNVDFFGVSALDSHSSQIVPRSQSFNPLHPVVLVSHLPAGDPAWVLLVGSSANDRVACDSANGCSASRPTSGPGAALEVRKITPHGFAGIWHTVNQDTTNQSAAKGYFCAAPPQFSPIFKSQTGHIAEPPISPP